MSSVRDSHVAVMPTGVVERPQLPPTLRAVVRAASQALVHLDADRLEELALVCRALNRPLPEPGGTEARALAVQAREAEPDMAVFERVLQATRDNLDVLRRLRALREGRLEYGAQAFPRAEARNGFD